MGFNANNANFVSEKLQVHGEVWFGSVSAEKQLLGLSTDRT